MKWPYSCTPLFIYDMTLFTIWPYLWYDLIYLRYDLIYDMTLFMIWPYLWYDLVYIRPYLFMIWPYLRYDLIYEMTLFMYDLIYLWYDLIYVRWYMYRWQSSVIDEYEEYIFINDSEFINCHRHIILSIIIYCHEYIYYSYINYE